MTSRAEEYRRYARQCLEIAPTFQDEEARATLLGVGPDRSPAWVMTLHARCLVTSAIVKHALDTGQGSEMADSLLDALEGSLRIFEKHRIFLLNCSGSSSALPPGDAATGRSCPFGDLPVGLRKIRQPQPGPRDSKSNL